MLLALHNNALLAQSQAQQMQQDHDYYRVWRQRRRQAEEERRRDLETWLEGVRAEVKATLAPKPAKPPIIVLPQPPTLVPNFTYAPVADWLPPPRPKRAPPPAAIDTRPGRIRSAAQTYARSRKARAARAYRISKAAAAYRNGTTA